MHEANGCFRNCNLQRLTVINAVFTNGGSLKDLHKVRSRFAAAVKWMHANLFHKLLQIIAMMWLLMQQHAS